MTKRSKPFIGRSSSAGKFIDGYKVLGTTTDGINILKPRGRPTHFTQKELRDAITRVRENQKAG